MNTSQGRFKLLLQRYFEKTASSDEREELFQLLRSNEYHQQLSSFIDEAWDKYALPDEESLLGDGHELLHRIQAAEQQLSPSPVRRMMPSWLKYAAAVVIIAGALFYVYLNQPPGEHPDQTGSENNIVADIPPGKNGAILTLGNGEQIVLDSAANGMLATQGAAEISLNNGEIIYDVNNNATGSTVYNTMQTPRGRQFKISLPDGSKVWLNAASSVKYPSVFTGNERLVEIQGEVYFEIAQDSKRPFKVKINDANAVEVLGTSFNISAYKNEQLIKTTLVQGSIKVTAFGTASVLTPGQQSVINITKKQTKISNPDLTQVIAWKNGLFNFEGMPLQEVMNQLERWYDIEVLYKAPVGNIDFYGKIDRNSNLSTIIQVLNASGVNCKLEGKQLIMQP